MPVTFRWLGVAGIEVRAGGRVLLIDPFFTRPSFPRSGSAGSAPTANSSPSRCRAGDAILVTHADFDHLMDVPDAARNTGAAVFGSPNACQLLRICGVAEEQVRAIEPGDRLALGPFQVDVLAGGHAAAPGFGPGPLRPGLRPPLRLRDYRMDFTYSFLVRVEGLSLLDWHGLQAEAAPAAELLFVAPFGSREQFAALLGAVRPRLVVPVHWDDLFRPLSKPIRPSLELPRPAWPPVRRADPDGFKRMIGQIAPGTAVLVPEALRVYQP